MIETISPGWDAPARVRACFTTRNGGTSREPYDSFNLGQHVGDEADAVRRNRDLLVTELGLPREPDWINQTHGVRCIDLDRDSDRDGDAALTRHPGVVAAVMVADCLPILLCNRAGDEIAAVHAGWRGLQAGVIQSAVTAMQSPASELMAWIGPGISQRHFEVGDEVREAFTGSIAGAGDFFDAHGVGHWLCDLAGLAQQVLTQQGITAVWRDPHCSFRDRDRFYSYRRDRVTGRMAALIWIN